MLVAQLSWSREQRDQAAAGALLPEFASSLAATNYAAWQEETGGEAPEVSDGLSVDQLYRYAHSTPSDLLMACSRAWLVSRARHWHVKRAGGQVARKATA